MTMLSYDQLEAAVQAAGYTTVPMGTPSCRYFGIDYGANVIGVSDECVCVYDRDAFYGGTEERLGVYFPPDATVNLVLAIIHRLELDYADLPKYNMVAP